ncbi:MAG TPA: V-type ATP synthase subunit A [Anaerolineales bacterium]
MSPNEVNGHRKGEVVRISGPVVAGSGMRGARLYEMVQVGERGLIGEVIRLDGDLTTVQVYEDTSGLRTGEPMRGTGRPLSVQLGPGLVGRVFDGLQRPLDVMARQGEGFIQRGVSLPPLPEDKAWAFKPSLEKGAQVSPGNVLGLVQESEIIEHRILVPPGVHGKIVALEQGEFTVTDTVAVIQLEDGDENELSMTQSWPVRQPRPINERIDPYAPLITGTRVIDAFFPVAKGGSAIIPGGFGTGKTVTQHSISRWSDVDIVIYVGCGERGNEMAEVLEDFPGLEDSRTGARLIERTVLIANTSNMPVAARESSIYTGITIAEYYRDMGYDVLILADSTSRWGEALREISGRLEEMPGEAGYPAYLASRLADFYERAGRVKCQGGEGEAGDQDERTGSVTITGAVSPPGGDFSEPVTQNSMRVTGTFWALDYDLSRRRHFPAINWNESYSLYELNKWYLENISEDWRDLTQSAMSLLQREEELQEIVQLVGPDALSDSERAVLFAARMIREDFLQQSAFDEIDRYSPLDKTFLMLKAIMEFYRLADEAIEAGVPLKEIRDYPEVGEIARMKEIPTDEAEEKLRALLERVRSRFSGTLE